MEFSLAVNCKAAVTFLKTDYQWKGTALWMNIKEKNEKKNFLFKRLYQVSFY